MSHPGLPNLGSLPLPEWASWWGGILAHNLEMAAMRAYAKQRSEEITLRICDLVTCEVKIIRATDPPVTSDEVKKHAKWVRRQDVCGCCWGDDVCELELGHDGWCQVYGGRRWDRNSSSYVPSRRR